MQHQYSIKLLTDIKMQQHNCHELRSPLKQTNSQEIEKVYLKVTRTTRIKD
jgi:hypothetical protein